MKKIIFKKTFFLIAIIFNVISVMAQDKVVMINDEIKEGKVTLVKDDVIKFVYKGETLEYEFNKSEIKRIEFASGRVEIINNTKISAVNSATTADRKGKIAVLPFSFITNEGVTNVEAMSQQLQTDTYNSVKQNTSSLVLQDPLTTNSLLAKSGLSQAVISTKTPAEIADILGVEFVLYGSANISIKGSSTYGSGFSTFDGKESTNKSNKKDNTKVSGTTYSSNNGSTTTNYETKINLSLYNNLGTNLYSEGRTSFGSGLDAYRATLNYLIKRCPFGSKAKH